MFVLFVSFYFVLTFGNIAVSLDQERIETDLEVIYGSYGVPVVSWYNETSSIAGQLTSVPGCPKSIDGIPWIYYGSPPRCFLAGHHGPCPIGQKLVATPGSPFGICACECVVDRNEFGTISLERETNGNVARYIECKSKRQGGNPYGQVFDTEANVCYEKGYQGPCKNDEILVYVESQSVKCEKTCARNGERGPGNVLGEDGVCRVIPVVYSGVVSLRASECGNEEKYSNILKKCVTKHSFIVG